MAAEFSANLSNAAIGLVRKLIQETELAVESPTRVSRQVTSHMRAVCADADGVERAAVRARDPALLRGVIQKEHGYSSTSRGAAPPDYHARGYRLELDVPAGSHGLWMGQESRNIYQRELILPRDLEYRIDEVIPNPTGAHYEGVDYLFRATVLPPGAP
ncbi:ADP-ribosyltransferase [Nocardia sp. NPDC056100]|uniref:ADP-ribosyltransferase n=1 Tax=Nocardia sp. NPDC056100 TaxID=3345712 RepID=UPI0035D5BD93